MNNYNGNLSMQGFFKRYFESQTAAFKNINHGDLEAAAMEIISRSDEGEIFFIGNGGSAAIASHAAIDATNAVGIKGRSFSDISAMTCYANDYDYENVYVRALLGARVSKSDILVAISSSGNSNNILNAVQYCKTIGMYVVTLSGFNGDNKLRALGDVNLYCASGNYNFVENSHQIWILGILDLVKSKMPREP